MGKKKTLTCQNIIIFFYKIRLWFLTAFGMMTLLEAYGLLHFFFKLSSYVVMSGIITRNMWQFTPHSISSYVSKKFFFFFYYHRFIFPFFIYTLCALNCDISFCAICVLLLYKVLSRVYIQQSRRSASQEWEDSRQGVRATALFSAWVDYIISLHQKNSKYWIPFAQIRNRSA